MWECGQLVRSLPRVWRHEVKKVGVGAVSSRAVCVLHKGAWLKRHMEAQAFLAWQPFTMWRATWEFAKRRG